MKRLLYIFIIAFSTLHIAKAQPTQEWVARYQRPAGSSGIANQMALDKVGNCYVLGNAPVNGSYGGIILIKYNSFGDTLWTRSYNQGTGNAAGNVNLVADSLGNVYITGRTGIGSFGPYDIVTIKFNSQGIQQWIKIYNSGGDDQPFDIIMDKFNNVYVAGLSGNESLVIKYNPGGDTIWTKKYTESGFRFPVTSIDIDNRNNVYIGGLKGNISNGTQNFYVIKYDSNGTFKWLNYHSNNGIEILNKAKVDQNFNLYVTGQSINGKIITVKYDSTGSQSWMVFYDGPGPAGGSATDMGIDSQGNIIVTGYSNGIGTGNYDYVTVKYNTFGDSLWVKRYNGTGNANDEAYSIYLDDSNNIYVTGRSINSGVSWDYVTLKYYSNGTQSWISIYNNQPTNAEDIAYKVIVDKNNNVFVSGSSRGVVGGPSDYVTIKYSQTVSINPITNNIPNKHLLEQNYPNPFNPNTIIKYNIVKNKTYARIVVYDIIGREIVTLVNEKHNKGIYEVTFDAGKLTSGIYFYKLIADEYTETRKMVLIK